MKKFGGKLFVKIENSIIMKNIFGVKYLQRKRRFNKWLYLMCLKEKAIWKSQVIIK